MYEDVIVEIPGFRVVLRGIRKQVEENNDVYHAIAEIEDRTGIFLDEEITLTAYGPNRVVNAPVCRVRTVFRMIVPNYTSRSGRAYFGSVSYVFADNRYNQAFADRVWAEGKEAIQAAAQPIQNFRGYDARACGTLIVRWNDEEWTAAQARVLQRAGEPLSVPTRDVRFMLSNGSEAEPRTRTYAIPQAVLDVSTEIRFLEAYWRATYGRQIEGGMPSEVSFCGFDPIPHLEE